MTRPLRFPLLLLIASLTLAPPAAAQLLDSPEQADDFGRHAAAGDFDGDGLDDLAVGVPGEDIDSISSAGAVHVLYGTPSGGLGVTGNQLWHQDSDGVEGFAEAFDRFGEALAVGDFNADGFDDLAVGVPKEAVGNVAGAGAVHVLYGTSGGLFSAGNQQWHQDRIGLTGICEENDHFGFALATGDFNGDGFDDLAVGTPGEGIGDLDDAGYVHVLFGATGGLTASGSQPWDQDAAVGSSGLVEAGDQFGYALAAGDFDADGFDDLAVGTPFEDVFTVEDAGLANVLYGTSAGLSSAGNQQWTQNGTGLNSVAEADDSFGWSLAAGDFDGDGNDDLAVGVPFEDVNAGPPSNIGLVHALYGGAGGLSSSGNQLWTQSSAGVQGIVEDDDQFGYTLAVGDLDGNGRDDLAVGAPGEAVIAGGDNVGVAQVLYGTATGLSADEDDYWSQLDLQEDPESQDWLGLALAAGDFDGDGHGDLAIGVPFDGVGGEAAAGVLHALYGTGEGLTLAGEQLWFQGANPVAAEPGAPEAPALALAAYPNPFAGRATLAFALPEAGPVRLAVYDALGRRVAVLLDAVRPAGRHAVAFDARGLPAGTYVVHLSAGGAAQTQRVTLVRTR